MYEKAIWIKSEKEIEGMRRAGILAARILREASRIIKPGISTQDIDDLVRDVTLKHGAICATMGYGASSQHGIPPFPKHCCTSVNEVVCHGIPSSNEILNDGDIINVDVTCILDGFHGDTSRTFLVGEVEPKFQDLVRVTQESMMRAISVVKPGARIREIGTAIVAHAQDAGYGVVKEFVGHGIGYGFHEPPQIHHYPSKGLNLRLRKGMTFTIEPMLNMGSPNVDMGWADGWTVTTEDGQRSAQFEHTILVTDDGYEILTDWDLLDGD